MAIKSRYMAIVLNPVHWNFFLHYLSLTLDVIFLGARSQKFEAWLVVGLVRAMVFCVSWYLFGYDGVKPFLLSPNSGFIISIRYFEFGLSTYWSEAFSVSEYEPSVASISESLLSRSIQSPLGSVGEVLSAAFKSCLLIFSSVGTLSVSFKYC